MISAKDLRVAPIASKAATALVRRLHYSGKVAANSQLHLGVFLGDQLEGAMQFGPSLDKRKIQGLVRDTPWNGFLELNRMAFSERLPRNSESRALGVALRMIRKHYPHVQWIISFADGTQCGDGTIYRAAGFVLTSIKKNTTIWGRDGVTIANLTVHNSPHQANQILHRLVATDTRRPGRGKALEMVNRVTNTKGKAILTSIAMQSAGHPGKVNPENGSASMKPFKDAGFKPLPGFQLRYVCRSKEQALKVGTGP